MVSAVASGRSLWASNCAWAGEVHAPWRPDRRLDRRVAAAPQLRRQRQAGAFVTTLDPGGWHGRVAAAGALPILGGAGGDELHIVAGLARQAAMAGEPVGDP